MKIKTDMGLLFSFISSLLYNYAFDLSYIYSRLYFRYIRNFKIIKNKNHNLS